MSDRGSTQGRLLVSTPLIGDANFARTVVFMIEHTDDAVVGVVLNRPTMVTLSEALDDWAERASSPAVLFSGGPVSPETGLALARPWPDAELDAYREVVPGLGVLDLEADAALVAPMIDRLRVFSGYAGWTPGQLEGELAVGAWFVVDADPDDALTVAPEDLYASVLRRQGGRLSWFANYPDEPSFN